MLTAVTSPHAGEEAKLERLLMPSIEPCKPQHILDLGRLVSLQLWIPWRPKVEKQELDDFCTALAFSPLPLPDLRHVRFGHRVLNRQPDTQWPPRIIDWWLSPSVHAATSSALPHLESLELDVVNAIDKAALTVLLDEAPRLHELIFCSTWLTYDVLTLAAERCSQLRSFLMLEQRGWKAHPVRLSPTRARRGTRKRSTVNRQAVRCTVRVLVCIVVRYTPHAARMENASVLAMHSIGLVCISVDMSCTQGSDRQLLAPLRLQTELRCLHARDGMSTRHEAIARRYWVHTPTKGSNMHRGVQHACTCVEGP